MTQVSLGPVGRTVFIETRSWVCYVGSPSFIAELPARAKSARAEQHDNLVNYPSEKFWLWRQRTSVRTDFPGSGKKSAWTLGVGASRDFWRQIAWRNVAQLYHRATGFEKEISKQLSKKILWQSLYNFLLQLTKAIMSTNNSREILACRRQVLSREQREGERQPSKSQHA